MTTHLSFNNINYNKSTEAVLFNIKIWISDLTFFKTEIEFFKKFINSYSFKSNTRNLFENIQLINKKLNNSESKRMLLLKKITTLKHQVNKNIEENKKDSNPKLLDKINNIEDEFLTFMETYKQLKVNLYTYFYGVLDV